MSDFRKAVLFHKRNNSFYINEHGNEINDEQNPELFYCAHFKANQNNCIELVPKYYQVHCHSLN